MVRSLSSRKDVFLLLCLMVLVVPVKAVPQCKLPASFVTSAGLGSAQCNNLWQ